MDTVTKTNYINKKYKKRKEYLWHFQLGNYHSDSISMMARLNVLVFILAYFMQKYLRDLITLDLTFCILGLVFNFVIKPKMLRGEIKAYYRRDYLDIHNLLFVGSILIYGGVLRTPIWIAFYALRRYLAQKQLNTSLVAYYNSFFAHILWNPIMTLSAIAFTGLLFYLMFYRDKYVSIEYFSNCVVAIYNSTAYNYQGAMQEFIRLRDEQLEKVFMNPNQPMDIVQSHTDSIKKANISLPPDPEIKEQEEPVTIRRKSRR